MRSTLAPLLQNSWATNSPLTGLDKAFANWLHSKQPSADLRHWWLAALTSHQWGRGHACLDLPMLETRATELLGWTQEQVAALPADLHQSAVTLPWVEGEGTPLVLSTGDALGGERLYLRRAWHAEQSIRHHVAQRLALPCTPPNHLQQRLDTLFPKVSADTANAQRLACEVAAQNHITLITGGPGTGKTTTVVKLLSLLVGSTQRDLRIHLAAPTGKAAARLAESIRHALATMPTEVQARIPSQTQTVHRLLQINQFSKPMQALAADVVVIDEASMIDLEMMAHLLQAVPASARLILLGDKDQLASVEAGAVMAQLCTGTLLKNQTVTLTHSHRFQTNSGIGQWARAVNAPSADNSLALKALWKTAPDWLSTLPSAAHSEASATQPDVTRLQLDQASDPKLVAGLRHGWRTWLALLAPHQSSASTPAYPCSDDQALALLKAFAAFGVLCAVRRGPMGVVHLNAQIEHALGLGQSSQWYTGRPVMLRHNNYDLDLMNGDIGLCLPCADGVSRVAFPSVDGGIRWVMPSRLQEVDTVFAMTVHKSQGSEFTHVLLVIPAQDTPVLSRELIYTGLTRARQHLTLWVPQLGVLWAACARRVVRSGGLSQ